MGKLQHSNAGLLIVRPQKQTMIPISKPIMTIGRRQCDIILDDPKISSKHAEIRVEGPNEIVLVDLQSTNGTFLNRKPISRVVLTDQDIIEIGSTNLCFFSDAREFNGAEAPIPKRKAAQKSEPISDNTQSTNRIEAGTSVTTTATLEQPGIRLVIEDGAQIGKAFRFKKSHITIGRNEADIVLLDADVSRTHAVIEALAPQSVYIRDLGSTNGTFVNSEKIQTQKLKNGDTISLGNSSLKIEIDSRAKES